MELENKPVFTDRFLSALKTLVEQHHSIYPRIPPQGIYFESLVEQAFLKSGWSTTQVQLTTTNTPKHDLLVGNTKLSLKTETGAGTNPDLISITKLCTTEREPWDSPTLIAHTMAHLSRYDHILMLRAIWQDDLIHCQLLEYLSQFFSFLAISPSYPLENGKADKVWLPMMFGR